MAGSSTVKQLAYIGDISFDGFQGIFSAGLCLFVEKQGMLVARGKVPGILKDLAFSKDDVDINFEDALASQDVEVKFKNTEPKHCQLGGCVFESIFKVQKIETIAEDVFEVFLTLYASPTGSAYSFFVDLNMHNPEARGWKPENVMMFGETFQCAAALVLSSHVGVNVLVGDKNIKYAESQVRFLRSTAKCPYSVTSSVASQMGSTPVKFKLDRITPLIAEVLADPGTPVLTMLRDAFTKEAREVCPLEGEQLLKSALGLDVTIWTGKTIAIFNRITGTANNNHFDLSAPQITSLGSVVQAAGATRMLVFGDHLDDLQKEAVDSLELEIADLTSFWKWDCFQQCFGCDVNFSAQCYIQLALQSYVCLNLGPHSGGTDYLGFMGSNVIFWTSTNHPAHPRMPRLTAKCDWWSCIPVGSTEEIKASRNEKGFPEEHEHILYDAITEALK